MYPPKRHQESDIEKLIEVIKTYPLATLISVNNESPLITHLPLIYKNDKLVGHIDIYNPQAEFLKDKKEVTVLFYGPQCYISPSIYSTTQLPTWNFIRVHIKGNVTAINDKFALRKSLIEMTEFLEAPNQKYVLEPDNPRMEKYLNYIQLFEIEIDEWEGKFKLSQDKKTSDTLAAREALIKSHQESIRVFLDSVFPT